MDKFKGSCHCGAIQIELSADLEKIIQCNCSICSKKGALHYRTKPENFALISGENNLSLYQFGTKQAQHLFCKTCGIHVFSRPRIAPEQYSVNVRCLEGIDIEKLTVVPFDGQNWERSVQELS